MHTQISCHQLAAVTVLVVHKVLLGLGWPNKAPPDAPSCCAEPELVVCLGYACPVVSLQVCLASASATSQFQQWA